MDSKEHQKKWIDYRSARRDDFMYYIDRSDMSYTLMAESTGIPIDWLKQVKNGRIKKPNDYRMTIVMDFIKDFERLQTYYSALAR